MNDGRGFQTYCDYILLKQHFKEPSFIWKENFNYRKLTGESFIKRNDAHFFSKIEKTLSKRRDRIELIVSAILFNPDIWIGDINEEVISFHKERMKRVSSLERTFRKDCENIQIWLEENNSDLAKILLTFATNDPIIVQIQSDLDICCETLIILDHITDFLNTWFPLNPLKKQRRFTYSKYKHLLRLAERDEKMLLKSYSTLAHSCAWHTEQSF